MFSKINGWGVLCNQTYNIGDDIQTIAAAQLLPQVDYYILRDNMSIVYDAKNLNIVPIEKLKNMKIAVIVSGWFMNMYNDQIIFPPENIEYMIPLFISMHISPIKQDFLYSDNCIEYYKKYEPIGCRDQYTYNRLIAKGVKAYISGCLTLSLKPKNTNRLMRRKIYYVVDKLPLNVSKNPNIEHVNHIDFNLNKKNVGERLKIAENLLKKYRTAKYVITDRLHCYLPCVAYGTTVKYIGIKDIRTISLVDQKVDHLFKLNNIAQKNINQFIKKFIKINV